MLYWGHLQFGHFSRDLIHLWPAFARDEQPLASIVIRNSCSSTDSTHGHNVYINVLPESSALLDSPFSTSMGKACAGDSAKSCCRKPVNNTQPLYSRSNCMLECIAAYSRSHMLLHQ
jgi:hypothetical protein